MRQKILPLLLFALFLAVSAYFDFWWTALDTLLSGPLGQKSQPLAAVLQIVLWLITAVFALFSFLGWIKNPGQQHGVDKRLQRAYSKGLEQSCLSLRLDLIAKPLKERRLRLTLSDIYQDQQVVINEERDPAADRSDREMLKETRKPVTLMEALETTTARHLVIRGQVGSGKTSFVNYLTLCILQSVDPKHRSAVPKNLIALPVARLYLREVGSRICCEKAGSSAIIWKELRDQAERQIRNTLEEDGEQPPIDTAFDVFWKEYQKDLKERGVILLDGLDEVAEDCGNNRRAVLRRAIEDFADNSVAETAWVIVTSRPYAYESEEQKLHGFQLLDMEPMQAAQVREFIRHWYLAARQANSWDEATATRRAVQLADEIEARSPYLPQLAETPLLLTLIIGLDYADIRLPVSRARLYEEAVELMLQRWNQRLQDFRKELSEAEREGLEVLERSRDELLEAMQALAYRSYQEIGACSNQSGAEKPLEFSKDMLLARLWDTFKQGQNHDNLIYFLEYRSGILIGGSRPEHFQFAHKSFHEYLAARCLMQKVQWKKEIEELLCRDMDWWREVFLLLLKKYSDVQYGESIQFIDHLLRDIPPQDIQPKEQKLILLFSVACVELNLAGRQEQDSLYRKVLGKLRAWLEEIMRGDALDIQQRAEAGRLLGELGDPRDGVTVNDKRQPYIDWMTIPAAKGFMMGSDDEDAYDDEKPAHPVDVEAFRISRSPITNAQYRCFIDAGGYKNPQFWQTEASRHWLEGGKADEKLVEAISDNDLKEDYERWLSADTERTRPFYWHERKWNIPNHPVVGVSWFEALAFCAWLSEVTGKTVRLPNEEEWEYAARGIQGLQYAWGDDFSENLGNTKKTGLERTSAVGLFPRGEAFGLHDMTGNVWEWTVNRWGKDIGSPQFSYTDWNKQTRDERECVNVNDFKVLRGGSWYNTPRLARCSVRDRNGPGGRNVNSGFRVVFSPAAC